MTSLSIMLPMPVSTHVPAFAVIPIQVSTSLPCTSPTVTITFWHMCPVGELGDLPRRLGHRLENVGGTELECLLTLPWHWVDGEHVACPAMTAPAARPFPTRRHRRSRRPRRGTSPPARRRSVAGGHTAADQRGDLERMSLSIFTAEASCTTMYGENVPSSVIG